MDFYEDPKYSIVIYKILKIIDTGFETNTFTYPESFNGLKLSAHRLDLIIFNLLDAGLIQGVEKPIPSGLLCKPVYNLDHLSLTLEGMLFLEENSSMKKAYKLLKGLRDWIPV